MSELRAPEGAREGAAVLVEAPGDGGGVVTDGRGRFDLLFEPSGRKVRVPPGVFLFDAASWNGVAIDSTCGGHGTCRKCKVQVLDGTAPITSLDTRAFSVDELKGGWRLACRVEVVTDLHVEVPPLVTRPKAATVGVGRKVILRPAVQKRYVELSEPNLSDQMTDLERLFAGMDDLELRPELSVLRTLGQVLRANDYKVTAVVVDDVLIAVEPGDTTERSFAIAFDLGTTTVVATLLDLSTGAPLAVQSMLNKQQPFGADVITRISAIMMDSKALEQLTRLAHESLDELAQAVCVEGGVDPSEVYEIAIAGNATMTHIVLGIDPESLGVAPFIMSTKLFPEVLANDVGVHVHERARAVMFPSLGAYVGGDIMAGLLASGMDRDSRMRLFLDIGTNCEVVLGNSDRLLATAAPAGPAFEGAAIRCGMRAAPGAIEVVKVSTDGVELGVIGDVEPLGLCGSGLVDVVAELVQLKLIDTSGRFVTDDEAASLAPGVADRLTQLGDLRIFVLHWLGDVGDVEKSIFLSQRDVRELQFAKAAIATGWQILLEDAGIKPEDLQQVLLAGSFGSYLSPASAIRLGLVPKLPLLRIVSAGNVAGEGAKMALLSLRERTGAMALLEEVEYVELSDRSDFNDQFVDQLAFPG
ncbi:MAG TPA: ASKHA domain-containing protein [Acidimicrobiales bacterium]